MTIDLPGHYVDFGVYFGKSFFSWHKFLEIFAPTATHKKVIGFDTFARVQNFAPEDGQNDPTIQKELGGLSSASFLDEFLDLLDLHNQDLVLPLGRRTIIQGDVCKTLPQWLDQNRKPVSAFATWIWTYTNQPLSSLNSAGAVSFLVAS